MKARWVLPLCAGLTLMFAACGQQGQTPVNPEPQKATLEIVVQGVAQANVQVAGSQGTVFDGAVAGSKTLTLDAGQYTVDGKPLAGYVDPSPTGVTLQSGNKLTATLAYALQATNPAAGTVKKLELVSVQDGAGLTLPYNKEVNDNKEVLLYASQTEEAVCVTVKATDAAGQAVAGAPIVVSTTELFGDHIAVIRGCAQSNQITTQAFRDGLTTDSNGLAVFTLYATFGATKQNLKDQLLLFEQPAKVVVAAENCDQCEQTAVIREFKVFFYNISHLYFGKNTTGQRSGKVFPTEVNIFRPLRDRIDLGDPELNEFAIAAGLFTKQPQLGIRLPNPMFNFKFEVTEGADRVKYSESTCNGKLEYPVCTDPDGRVKIEPKDGLGLKDLPIQATVKVTLLVQYTFGKETYVWPLKDFTLSKKWVGTYLKISKSVDHHVLTWAGPEHHLHYGVKPADLTNKTLASADDHAVQAGSVFTATMTVKLVNLGKEPAYEITLADALPPELGILTDTVTPSGSTYDSANHVLTWNWERLSGQPKFKLLQPGEEISVSFQVYLRQKPGFVWDGGTAPTQVSRVVPDGRYPDPYKVVNGAASYDVTGTWFSGAPRDKDGVAVKIDFNGVAAEKDVVVWGVRPVFKLSKAFDKTPSTIDVGSNAYYKVSILNTNRERYNALASSYPAEFNGKVRDNPYGRNVRLTDVFDRGLDFVNATALSLTDDEALFTYPASGYPETWIPNKGIVWALVPVMGGGDSGSSLITLRANLPSPMILPVQSTIKCPQDKGYWYNCAFLDADNLNQPKGYDAEWDNKTGMVEQRGWDFAPLHENLLPELRYGLRDCVQLIVVPRGEPWIELNDLGEHVSALPGSAELTPVHAGATYFYHFIIGSHGDSRADGITFSVKMDTTKGQFASFSTSTADHRAYVSSNGGVSWGAPFSLAATSSSTEVKFSSYNLPAGYVLLYVLKTEAQTVGNVVLLGTANYSNAEAQQPLLPLSVVETTSIQAP